MGLFDALFVGGGDDTLTEAQFEGAVCAIAFVGFSDGVLSEPERREIVEQVGATPWARELSRDAIVRSCANGLARAQAMQAADARTTVAKAHALAEALVVPSLCERVLELAVILAGVDDGRLDDDEHVALTLLSDAFGIEEAALQVLVDRAWAARDAR